MGNGVPVFCKTTVTVTYDSKTVTLPLITIEGEGAALLGRNCLNNIRLNWGTIHLLANHSSTLHNVL
uniref:Uncharacterized protein n=1 Tax=Amphimedon queenslandica TaxID=400682 RepID=A0A1X7VG74_AMPQE